MLLVGVMLPAAVNDVGEYLADVTALEAAGADTIWVDDSAREPWILLGALAAVTHRVRLGCRLASTARWPAPRLGSSAAALQRLSHGRLVVGLPERGMQTAHAAALRAAGAGIFDVAPDGQMRLRSETGAHIEVWATIAIPPDREAWSTALSTHEARGATGVIVPWSDRVVDLLRNPEPDDRSDLLISTG
jgi:hypothetical protein